MTDKNPDFFVEARYPESGCTLFKVYANAQQGWEPQSVVPLFGRYFVMNRDTLVAMMAGGIKFVSVFKRAVDGTYRVGSEIHVVSTAHGKYLRTDPNSVSADNLNELAVF